MNGIALLRGSTDFRILKRSRKCYIVPQFDCLSDRITPTNDGQNKGNRTLCFALSPRRLIPAAEQNKGS
jgi:hypothetical protein